MVYVFAHSDICIGQVNFSVRIFFLQQHQTLAFIEPMFACMCAFPCGMWVGEHVDLKQNCKTCGKQYISNKTHMIMLAKTHGHVDPASDAKMFKTVCQFFILIICICFGLTKPFNHNIQTKMLWRNIMQQIAIHARHPSFVHFCNATWTTASDF